eukprot:2059504-Rhodomonas_salina.3
MGCTHSTGMHTVIKARSESTQCGSGSARLWSRALRLVPGYPGVHHQCDVVLYLGSTSTVSNEGQAHGLGRLEEGLGALQPLDLGGGGLSCSCDSSASG